MRMEYGDNIFLRCRILMCSLSLFNENITSSSPNQITHQRRQDVRYLRLLEAVEIIDLTRLPLWPIRELNLLSFCLSEAERAHRANPLI